MLADNPEQMHTQLLIRRRTDAVRISVGGSIDAASAEAFAQVLEHDVRALAYGDRTIHLDLDDLELDDGSAVAQAVNALRRLLQHGAVVIHHAPQMLAHTLYKAGLLDDQRLRLETPRVDEPSLI